MAIEKLQEKMNEANRRLAGLRERVGREPHRIAALLASVLEETATLSEELHVAVEELRLQNEQIISAREALEAERQYYRDLFHFAPDGYLVTDTNGIIQAANHTAAVLLNLSVEAVTGKQLSGFVAEEERPFFQSALPWVLARGHVRDWRVGLQLPGRASMTVSMSVMAVRNQSGDATALRWLMHPAPELKWAERALEFLAKTGEVLSRVMDKEAGLKHVARLAVASIADCCVFDLRDDASRLRRVAWAHHDERLQKVMDERYGSHPSFDTTDRPVSRVIEIGRAMLVFPVHEGWMESRSADSVSYGIMPELNVRSLIVAPIMARERVLGVLAMCLTASDRRYGFSDLALAEELGRRTGLALENLFLFQTSQQSEEGLRRQVQELETLYQSTALGFCLVDEDLRFLRLNGVLAEMCGVSADGAIGRRIGDVVPDLAEVVEPLLRRVKDTGMPVLNTEIRGMAAQGKRLGRVWLANFYPLHGPDGRVSAMSGLVQEITERKRAEEALRRAYDQLETKIEAKTAQLKKANEVLRNEIAERRRAEAELQKAHDELEMRIRERTQDLAETNRRLQAEIAERRQAEQELQAAKETLEERVRERTSALLVYQQQLRSLASELSRAEEKERHRIASELHDNLAQMLAFCKLKLAALERQWPLNQPPPPLMQLKELLDQALTYTRTLMSDLRPAILGDEDDLLAAIRWVVEKMQRHGLKVEVIDDGKPKSLHEDVLRVTYQSLQELLCNVLKHARTQQATVSLRREGRYLHVVVADKGIGFNASQKRAPTPAGGFGLFNIQERLDMIGGHLAVRSAPGHGTQVTLVIPLKCKTRLASKGTNPASAGRSRVMPWEKLAVRPAESKIRVLLADDHRIMREGLRSIIQGQADLEVVAEAADGRTAVEAARETRPDVVVMDVNMPTMNGLEATRQIKADLPEVEVIGLSVHDDEHMAAMMREAGASAYLSKGGAFETLCATIRERSTKANRSGAG